MADHLYSARGIPRIRLAYTAYPARQDDNGRRFRMHEIVLLPLLSTAGEFSKDEGFINNFHRLDPKDFAPPWNAIFWKWNEFGKFDFFVKLIKLIGKKNVIGEKCNFRRKWYMDSSMYIGADTRRKYAGG